MKPLQCKDIPDRPIIEFLALHGGIGCHWFRLEEDTRSVVHAMPEGIPEKLVLAKMKQLIKRGIVSGCGCGCRGDFELTSKGQDIVSQSSHEDEAKP